MSQTPLHVPARKPIVKVSAVAAIANVAAEAKIADIRKKVKIGTTIGHFKQRIDNLLVRYSDVFAGADEPLGETSAAEFDVDTGSSPPVAQQKYKTPYFLRNELKNIIDRNLATALMEECTSPWAAPVLKVRKTRT